MTKPALTNEEAYGICVTPDDFNERFVLQQTGYRIKDPRKTLAFYTGVMGMRLILKKDFPDMKFSLYFLGYANDYDIVGDPESRERIRWVLAHKSVLELTHNWGTENDPNFKHHNGNTNPRGYGHIGIMVPDLNKACKRFEKQGVKFEKRLEDGIMRCIAYVSDPDGYWIEIYNNRTTAASGE